MCLDRIIVIHGDQLIDVIEGEREEMRGDAIVRERVGRLLARDCARRKLMSAMLPAVDVCGRDALAALVESWTDDETRDAGREILAAAWGANPATSDESRPRVVARAR